MCLVSRDNYLKTLKPRCFLLAVDLGKGWPFCAQDVDRLKDFIVDGCDTGSCDGAAMIPDAPIHPPYEILWIASTVPPKNWIPPQFMDPMI